MFDRLPLLTLRQAAEWLAVSPRKVWQMARDGTLPVVRVGRALRFAPADIERVIQKLKTPTASDDQLRLTLPWTTPPFGVAPNPEH